MTEIKLLDRIEGVVLCDIDVITKLPKHSGPILVSPGMNSIHSERMCNDSRVNECEFGTRSEGVRYCSYKIRSAQKMRTLTD